MDTVRDLLFLWPSNAELGRDVGTTSRAVAGWKQTGIIPEFYWAALVKAAKKRNLVAVTKRRISILHRTAGRDSFTRLIDLWPSYAELARDLGITYNTVAAWKHRDSIPPAYWDAVIGAAELRNLPRVTRTRMLSLCRDRIVQRGGNVPKRSLQVAQIASE